MITEKTNARRLLLRMSMKNVQKGSGSLLNLLNMQQPVISPILQQALANLPYLLIGGLAVGYYMPIRFTQDADIVILSDKQETVEEHLIACGYRLIGLLSVGGKSYQSVNGEILDVLISNNDYIKEAMQQPNIQNGINVMPMPYLVLMKIMASRVQDLADATRMLGFANESDLQKVRDLIARFLPDALEDIESMIWLGKLELE